MAVADAPKPRSIYLVDAVLRACDLLEAFQFEGELVRLRELVSRTGMNKTTAFRLLTTLEERGLIERIGAHHIAQRSNRSRGKDTV